MRRRSTNRGGSAKFDFPVEKYPSSVYLVSIKNILKKS